MGRSLSALLDQTGRVPGLLAHSGASQSLRGENYTADFLVLYAPFILHTELQFTGKQACKENKSSGSAERTKVMRRGKGEKAIP